MTGDRGEELGYRMNDVPSMVSLGYQRMFLSARREAIRFESRRGRRNIKTL
jgi:hypothetical protein